VDCVAAPAEIFVGGVGDAGVGADVMRWAVERCILRAWMSNFMSNDDRLRARN
jgi:hypothetical protein